ncbi:MAG TPA: cupredoxin domain-containing protein [Mycobacteriales bacterium]|nr:cupredoxin domain-containing protein [Mycobacteriales bacterium]
MTRALRLGAAALTLVAMTACGGDDADDAGTDSASQPGSSATSGAPAADGDVIEVKATQQLKFDPATLTATVGSPFNGKIVQVGSIPHNIEIKEFGVKPGDTMTTKDGEAKAFSFTPDKAGKFEYVCTIHPAQMKGTLTVS